VTFVITSTGPQSASITNYLRARLKLVYSTTHIVIFDGIQQLWPSSGQTIGSDSSRGGANSAKVEAGGLSPPSPPHFNHWVYGIGMAPCPSVCVCLAVGHKPVFY